MGIGGSQPDVCHQSVSGLKEYRRYTVPKKYSLPAHSSRNSYAEEQFFPPPILHTKFHELNLNSSVSTFNANINQLLKQSSETLKSDGMRRVLLSSREICDTFTLRNNKLLVVPRSFCRSSTNSNERKIGIVDIKNRQLLSTSSVSSGVDSVLEEDSEVDIEKLVKNEGQCDAVSSERGNYELVEKQASKKNVVEADLHIPRCSLDSGASFDDDDEAKNPIFAESYEKISENVFDEKGKTDGSLVTDMPQEIHLRRKSSFKRKKNRKFSLVKSFRKMSKRAVSLPSAFMASASKS